MSDAEGGSSLPWFPRLPWLRLIAEFGVIFLGVTLGLLADDWRQSREDRETEVRALGELLSDLEADSIGLDALRANMVVHDRSAMWIFQRLGRSGVSADSAAVRLGALYPWQAYQAPRATYAGLRASGRLVVIRNDDLRRAITYYYEERQPYLLGFYESYSDFWTPLRKAMSQDLQLVYPPGAVTFAVGDTTELVVVGEPEAAVERAGFRLTTPWDRFPTDPGLGYYLTEVGILSNVIVVRGGEVLEEIGELRASIRAYLGR